jgi:hypothetical protein
VLNGVDVGRDLHRITHRGGGRYKPLLEHIARRKGRRQAVIRVRRHRASPPPVLTPEQIERICEACASWDTDTRQWRGSVRNRLLWTAVGGDRRSVGRSPGVAASGLAHRARRHPVPRGRGPRPPPWGAGQERLPAGCMSPTSWTASTPSTSGSGRLRHGVRVSGGSATVPRRASLAVREIRPGITSRQDAPDRVRSVRRPSPSGTGCREARDVRLSWLHAHLREDQDRAVGAEAQDHLETDAGEAGRGQRPPSTIPAPTHPRTRPVAGKRNTRIPRLLRGARQHRRRGGLPHPSDEVLVQGAAAPQPTHSPQLDADEPPGNSMATTRPHEASLPKRALRRQDPRQEPSALAAHAGICAGGRLQGRSLPRSAPAAHDALE